MDKSVLVRLVADGNSIREIARLVGSSYTNTNHWLKKFGLITHKKVTFSCACGERDPSKFYGHKRSLCGKCLNTSLLERGRQVRLKMVQYLGGKCVVCGYATYSCSLDVHHLDASKKDPTFHAARFWTWSRVEKELRGCVLLCKNCHAATHAGLVVPPHATDQLPE